MQDGPRAEDEDSDATPENLEGAPDVGIGNDRCASRWERAERPKVCHSISLWQKAAVAT